MEQFAPQISGNDVLPRLTPKPPLKLMTSALYADGVGFFVFQEGYYVVVFSCNFPCGSGCR